MDIHIATLILMGIFYLLGVMQGALLHSRSRNRKEKAVVLARREPPIIIIDKDEPEFGKLRFEK